MLLHIENVKKTYHLGEVPVEALKGVSLNIDRGEFIAICGPSGSGKSTLLNMIGTIDVPTSGNIFYEGKDVLKMNDDAQTAMRNSTIGFIFQTFNLVPVLSALENVMLPLHFRRANGNHAKEKAVEHLKAVGLEKYMHHRPNKLSGGQRQRVAIARAMAHEPSIIIADEPTANLDSVNAQQILDIMRNMNQQQQVTFIFSTHDQRLIDHVQRTVWLEDGLIKSDARKN
ncbi:ABC transporter, ATP-binding protein [Candidatus Moduliflexus flocculans]|uniref:ABC transporter, ATP-binding protein n=1 Tax=Candidatus Moduliflexus flocculans TaxID=1499966 RepID=A0A081BQX7_9BACT|nr:ABC transporter, ATP-binding protein [Candidatus Moduliflexus flocculans]